MAIPKIKRIYPQKKKKRVKKINKELYVHERETRYLQRREKDDGSRSRKARNWEWEAEPKFHHGGPVPLLEAPEGPFSLIFFL